MCGFVNTINEVRVSDEFDNLQEMLYRGVNLLVPRF